MQAVTDGLAPVIDLASARAGDFAGAGKALDAALRSPGFCYLANHGIPSRTTAAVMLHAPAYFRLPQEAKRACTPGLAMPAPSDSPPIASGGHSGPAREAYFEMGPDIDKAWVRAREAIGRVNQWPAEVPAFMVALTRYHDETRQCGRALMHSVASALGVDQDFFEQRYKDPLHRTRAIHYPARSSRPPSEAAETPARTDRGCATLLWQDRLSALEVQTRDGRWLEALPVAETLLFFVGDLLQRWSNDRYRSTPYRPRQFAGEARLSITSYYDPDCDAVVDPSDLCLRQSGEARYGPVVAGEFIMGRLAQSLEPFGEAREP